MDIYAYVNRKGRQRKGRGFSNGELAKAGLSSKQALKLGIQIDPRRSTLHDQNVETLKTYLSEGTPKFRIEVKLTEIRGIGPKRCDKLRAVGVDTVEKLAKRDIHEIAEQLGVSTKTSARWIETAKTLLAG